MKTEAHKRVPSEAKRQPTHIAKFRIAGFGPWSKFERIGAAWQRDNGSIYVCLNGAHTEGFYLFPIEPKQ